MQDKLRDPFWGYSECMGGWLHRLTVIEQYPECTVELCILCKNKFYFKTVGGNPDNLEYLDYHARQVLFPQHPFYQHEYEFQPLTA